MKLDKKNWQTVRFGDVVYQGKGAVDPETSGLERYIAGEHMNSEDLHLRQWGTVGEGYLGPAFHRLFEKGDILYGSRRTYLKKIAVADFDGITANTTFVIKENPELVEPGLIAFLMLSDRFTENSVKNSKGSVNPYINFKDIAKFEFRLPPREQQMQLVELLWAADEVGEQYQDLINRLENSLNILVEKELYRSGIPRKKLSTVVTGIIAGTSVNGLNTPQIASHEKAVLKVSAIGRRGFVPSESKVLISQDDFIPKLAVRKGNLLITRANTKELVGRVCLVDLDYPNLMLCDKTLEIVVNNDLASKAYLVEVLKSLDTRKQIEGLATGTSDGMKNISQKGILSIELPLPGINEQLAQANRLQSIKAQVANSIQTLGSHVIAKQQLINRIFSA